MIKKLFPLTVCFLIFQNCTKGPDNTIVIDVGDPLPVGEISGTPFEIDQYTMLGPEVLNFNVDAGSYLLLADNEGNVAKIEEGFYTYKMISKNFYKLSKGYKSLPEKYISYIWQEMQQKEKTENYNVKTAVLRSRLEGQTKNAIFASPEFMEIINGDEIDITWYDFNEDTVYNLSIIEVDGDFKAHYEINDTSFSLDAGELKAQTFYYHKLEGSEEIGMFFYDGPG